MAMRSCAVARSINGRAMAPTCSSFSKLAVLIVCSSILQLAADASSSYEESQRHQNFGKYHTTHMQAPSPASASASPSPPQHPYMKPPSQLTHVSSHGTTLAVEGVVVCLSCKYARFRSLTHATPLQGAKVQLACRDMRFKTFVLATATTDKHGYFLFLVKDFEFKRHKGVRGCRAMLFSSPDSSCARVTNVNFGKIGSPLVSRQKVYSGEILYSVGPFAFAPSSSACYKH